MKKKEFPFVQNATLRSRAHDSPVTYLATAVLAPKYE
jgi:hypothetical protein